MQQLLGKRYAHHVHKLALKGVLDLEREAHDHNIFHTLRQMRPLEFIKILQLEWLRCGDIDRIAEEVRQGGRRRAHHLIHHLAHGADGQIIKLKLFLRRLGAHKDINDDLDVALAQQHDVAALKPLYILDLHAHRGFELADGEILDCHDGNRRCRDVHTVIEHIRYGRCRGAEADVHHFPNGIYFHWVKQFFLHSPIHSFVRPDSTRCLSSQPYFSYVFRFFR